ncbi:hypothetical protein EOA60_25000 [Mesorhizobium sp. M1A.F.Ca.IN.020.06.1.1]|nr:hypothetical protein EOA51_31965 [Mesorhizobium sp. M1A.F.Ca.IN.020.32.1.1]RUW20977.1 hypothetical protein EOA60_25000 [Mesorhizobium sp. M1A.F.Ca.IN.020.06.1.1]RWF74195.1 MAG: hypothetical protein EOQ35_29410 [Mesorhizobium sp.]RWF94470.1 MAG: hypothetical protein EOQ38_27360 [Mesorhizobium sp.]RWG73750.1 MAG: hypothetical protein EOQ68_28855 [Mesorhizobium sp.]
MNRRAVLFHSGSAIFASTLTAVAHATDAQRPQQEPSCELRALVESHMTAYEAFGKVVQEVGGKGRDYDNANREEERALLAICAYPAITQADRLTRPRYLLEVEALDLPEQMKALIHSIM